MDASIIICTYNRCKFIDKAIASALAQQTARGYEVLVVDNNSTDQTREVVERLSQESAKPIRYVSENRQGLSHARNKGVELSRGDIILFIDDDAVADTHWLERHVSAYSAGHVCCAGGPVRPVWPFQRPPWLTDDMLGYLSVNNFEALHEKKQFSGPLYPYGTNISFRKGVFEIHGMFPSRLGRTGQDLLSNEESYICRRIEQSGKEIAFIPNAVVHHHIPPERLNRLWVCHRAYAQGRSDALLDGEFESNARDVFAKLFEKIRALRIETGKPDIGDMTLKLRKRNIYGYLSEIANHECGAGSLKKRVEYADAFISAASAGDEGDKRYIQRIEDELHEIRNSKIWRWTRFFR